MIFYSQSCRQFVAAQIALPVITISKTDIDRPPKYDIAIFLEIFQVTQKEDGSHSTTIPIRLLITDDDIYALRPYRIDRVSFAYIYDYWIAALAPDYIASIARDILQDETTIIITTEPIPYEFVRQTSSVEHRGYICSPGTTHEPTARTSMER